MPMPFYLRGLAKFYQYGNQLATTEALRLFNSDDQNSIRIFRWLQSCQSLLRPCQDQRLVFSTANEIARSVEAGLSGRLSTARMTQACSAVAGGRWRFVVRDLGVGHRPGRSRPYAQFQFAEAWRCSGWNEKLARRSETGPSSILHVACASVPWVGGW